MKRMRRLFVLVLSVLLALPLCAAEEGGSAEANIVNTEDAAAFFTRCAEIKASSLTLYCSAEAYALLSRDGFALTKRLLNESHVYDFELRYSDSARKILVEKAVYRDRPFYAYAETLEQAENALYRFVVVGGLTEFSLGCGENVFDELLTRGGIYSVTALLGVENFSLRYTPDTLLISGITMFSGAWARADGVYDAANKIASWHENGTDSFTLVFGRDVYASLTDFDFDMLRFAAGIEGASTLSYPDAGRVTFSDVVWADCPGVYCEGESDIVSAIKSMGAAGISNFRIMTDADYYDTLMRNDFAALHALEAKAGMSGSRMSYYTDTPVIVYTDAVIVADAQMLTSVDEVIAFVNARAQSLDDTVTLFLTAGLYDTLLENRAYGTKRYTPIDDITSNAGMSGLRWSCISNTNVIILKDIEYYPGFRIIRALEKGEEAGLSPRDAQTLASARSLARTCAGNTEFETLLNLHDALCRMIVYTDDETTDEDDCAVGALLNGRANCDGYADALYLSGRLCGLEVIYQHGDGAGTEAQGSDALHMWNGVKTGGAWYMVDATWDDREGSEPMHAYFLIGKDRAGRTHIWDESMTVCYAAKTDSDLRAEPEYMVSNSYEAGVAVNSAVNKGEPVFNLYAAAGSGLTESVMERALFDNYSGACGYMWIEELSCLRVELR